MGVLMSKAASVQGTAMMILFPLTFMSNAFVPADTMPGWMQAFVNVTPYRTWSRPSVNSRTADTSESTRCTHFSAPP